MNQQRQAHTQCMLHTHTHQQCAAHWHAHAHAKKNLKQTKNNKHTVAHIHESIHDGTRCLIRCVAYGFHMYMHMLVLEAGMENQHCKKQQDKHKLHSHSHFTLILRNGVFLKKHITLVHWQVLFTCLIT